MSRASPSSRCIALALLAVLAACQPRQAESNKTAPLTASPNTPAIVAYVPNQKSGTISVIDTGKDQVVRTLRGGTAGLGQRLQQIALDPSGTKLYVIDAEHHRLLLLDIASDQVERSLDIGEGAEGVGLSPDGTQLAVCVEQQNQVMFIDAKAFAQTRLVAIQGRAPEHCVWTPDGKQVITSNEGSDSLDLVDATQGRSVASIATSGHPRGLVFGQQGKAYVAQESANVVDVIDLAQRRKVASIPAGLRTAGLTVSADGRRLYASNGGAGTVTVIDTATDAVLGQVTVGERPWNPALTPDGRKLYVANGRSDSVSVVDTATLKQVALIKVDQMPWGVIIGP